MSSNMRFARAPREPAASRVDSSISMLGSVAIPPKCIVSAR